MKFDRLDKKALYQSFERHARQEAESATDPKIKASWELAAESWRILAGMIPERCFCGRSAVGFKYYEDGGSKPYCGEHLHEAILQDLRIRSGLAREN